MTGTFLAFHIRIGDDPLAVEADSWLDRHKVPTQLSTDARDACARMAVAGDWQPTVVLLGLNWLAAEDLAIIDYAQRAWPGSTIIGYGRHSLDPSIGLITICTSADQLADALFGALANNLRSAESRVVDCVSSNAKVSGDTIGRCDERSRGSLVSEQEITLLLGSDRG